MLRFIIFIIMLSSNVSAQTPDEVKEFVKSTTDNILITKSMSEHDREKSLSRSSHKL